MMVKSPHRSMILIRTMVIKAGVWTILSCRRISLLSRPTEMPAREPLKLSFRATILLQTSSKIADIVRSNGCAKEDEKAKVYVSKIPGGDSMSQKGRGQLILNGYKGWRNCTGSRDDWTHRTVKSSY